METLQYDDIEAYLFHVHGDGRGDGGGRGWCGDGGRFQRWAWGRQCGWDCGGLGAGVVRRRHSGECRGPTTVTVTTCRVVYDPNSALTNTQCAEAYLMVGYSVGANVGAPEGLHVGLMVGARLYKKNEGTLIN